jgi:hypothetical protein
MFIPMMESTDHRSDPRQLNSFHPDRQGIARAPTATGTETSYSPLHYVSPSEVPFYYPKAGPSPVQALPMFPGRPGGAGYTHDHNKRSRDGTSSAPPSISTPQFTSTHSSQVRSTSPPTDNNPHSVAHAQQQHQQPAKRTRLATYTPPRNPTKNANLLAAMGSLAAGPATAAATEPPKNGGGAALSAGGMIRVPFRRQLSGSRLEGFLGNHDSMDVDESGAASAESRPRSMSF